MNKVASAQIKLIRKRRGLSTSQLAHRLAISQSSVVRMEQSEAQKTISLQLLERAAEAMECDLEYRFVPRKKLKGAARSFGLKRISQPLRTGALSRAMKQESNKIFATMSPEERLRYAFELSDFFKKLQS